MLKYKLVRKFDGKRFYYYGKTKDKRQANNYADKLRRRGYKVRIVKSGEYYIGYRNPERL